MTFLIRFLPMSAASSVVASKNQSKFLKATLVATLLCCAYASTCLAQATVSPTSLSWASVAVGNAGGQKPVTLTNTGTTSINISNIVITGTNAGDFSIFSKTCGTSLAASASCSANIIFKPTTTGTRTATLTFTDTASNSPQTVPLSGTGTSGAASVSCESHDAVVWKCQYDFQRCIDAGDTPQWYDCRNHHKQHRDLRN